MAKKTKKAKKDKTAAGAARETMAALIRKKEGVVGDGSLQVLLALASVTSLVTVDAATSPPTVVPENIGQLTFGDPAVGLTDDGVAIFKANLKELLPAIAEDIDQIPDNANLNIADVARFVQLSLMSN
jgi:hypothetical protein